MGLVVPYKKRELGFLCSQHHVGTQEEGSKFSTEPNYSGIVILTFPVSSLMVFLLQPKTKTL